MKGKSSVQYRDLNSEIKLISQSRCAENVIVKAYAKISLEHFLHHFPHYKEGENQKKIWVDRSITKS